MANSDGSYIVEMTIEEITEDMVIHCPFCNRAIYPHNVEEVVDGLAEDDAFIYTHDDVWHDEDYGPSTKAH